MSYKRMIAVLAGVMVVFSCMAMLASTNKENQQRTIQFSAPTVVGGTLLPAGDYTVMHEMNGATHVMIFKQVRGKAEAKSNCNMVPLKAKAERTEQSYTTNAKNERVLQEFTFSGDMTTHVLAQ